MLISMGILIMLIAYSAQLFVALANVTIAFYVVSILVRCFRWPVLLALDRIGGPLVDETTRLVRRYMEGVCKRRMPYSSAFVTALLCLILARAVAIAVVRGLGGT